jgi:hypothetical protein
MRGALRLQASLLEEARRVSEGEGVALNQFINVAVAEKLSALRTEEYFRARAQRGNIVKAKRFPPPMGKISAPVCLRSHVEGALAPMKQAAIRSLVPGV